MLGMYTYIPFSPLDYTNYITWLALILDRAERKQLYKHYYFLGYVR